MQSHELVGTQLCVRTLLDFDCSTTCQDVEGQVIDTMLLADDRYLMPSHINIESIYPSFCTWCLATDPHDTRLFEFFLCVTTRFKAFFALIFAQLRAPSQ